jgi:O-antigen/teichoic acid export membrane protein
LIERQTLFGLIADIIGVSLNIVLNLLLIPRLGAQGAAIATIIAYSWVSCFSLLATSKTRKLFQFVAISLVTPWRGAPMVARRLRGALARRSG